MSLQILIRNLRTLLVLSLVLSPLTLWAEPDKTVQVELWSSAKKVTPGQKVWMVLHLKMNDHWHVYWRNPGSAGFPPTLTWQDEKKAELQWPLPKKSNLADIWSYVYEDEVVLPFEFQVPPEAKNGPLDLKGKAKWLACKESCIPGNAAVEIHLEVASAFEPSEQNLAIEKARQLLPLTSGLQAKIAKVDKESIKLEFRGVGDIQSAEFFPYDQKIIDDGAPQKFEVSADTSSLVLKRDGTENPSKINGVVQLQTKGGPQSYQIEAGPDWPAASTEPQGSTSPSNIPTGSAGPGPVSFAGALAGAVLGGMILNLMPCVFPVLSLKIMGLVQHRDPEHKPLVHGAAFAIGVLLSFWAVAGSLLLLRASGSQFGWGFQLQSPKFVALMACLFFGIALNLFGLFEVGEGLTQYGEYSSSKSGYSESFWSGALATLVATPCSAPFMGAAVGYALTQPTWKAMLIFTALGIGMALPYVLLTAFPSLLRFLPRPGVWMETFKQFMAFPMLLAVVWFLWILGSLAGNDGMSLCLGTMIGLGLAAWVMNRWGYAVEETVQKRAKIATAAVVVLSLAPVFAWLEPAKRTTAGIIQEANGIAWQPYSEAEIEKARQQGKTVFVDFTADWCLSCKANEKVALKDPAVIAQFKNGNVAAFKADWTSGDPGITAALAKFGRSGVPLYVVYKGTAAPKVLPEVIGPGLVLSEIK